MNQTKFTQTLSEMTGNVSLFIMRKADTNKNGYIELQELSDLALDDPVAYQLIEDLVNFAPDFMDQHRQVLTSAGPKQVQ